ncbi:MAG: RpiB/LacA/LacB family sugar-phosphate isomerase [Rhodospirillales bacterium]|jgi:ribose 5-phosphate isomerase B|nr:RpiB/LacA/LacB family sugar-phosphate isomerase [Rhodospirillales bacterium]
MKICLGGDATSHFVEAIHRHIQAKGIETVACGALCGREADYVDAASEVAEMVSSGACDFSVLFCTTGTGVTIVANKFPGVRAAMCYDTFSAEISKLANNANVLVLSIRYTGERLGKEIVDAWLATTPSTEPRRVSFHRKTDEVDARTRRWP